MDLQGVSKTPAYNKEFDREVAKALDQHGLIDLTDPPPSGLWLARAKTVAEHRDTIAASYSQQSSLPAVIDRPDIFPDIDLWSESQLQQPIYSSSGNAVYLNCESILIGKGREPPGVTCDTSSAAIDLTDDSISSDADRVIKGSKSITTAGSPARGGTDSTPCEKQPDLCKSFSSFHGPSSDKSGSIEVSRKPAIETAAVIPLTERYEL